MASRSFPIASFKKVPWQHHTLLASVDAKGKASVSALLLWPA